MKLLILWVILLIVCWPLAIAALVLYPSLWIILLPLRILGFTLDVVFDFLTAVIRLPFRVMGLLDKKR